MSKRALCVVCGAPMAEGHHSLWCRAAAAQGCPGDALLLCLMVLLKFSLGPGLCASRPRSGFDEAGTWAAETLPYTATPCWAVGSGQWASCSSLTLCSVQWAVEVLLYTSSVHCLAMLGSGQRESFSSP